MKFLRRFDWVAFATMLALISIGTVAIWSAGNARAETAFHGMWLRNLLTAVSGLSLYFTLSVLDYRKWISLAALPVYILSVALLVAVLVFGSEQFGGRRWLWFFQPSEVSKLAVLVLMASFFGSGAGGRTGFFGFVLGFGLAPFGCGLPGMLYFLLANWKDKRVIRAD